MGNHIVEDLPVVDVPGEDDIELFEDVVGMGDQEGIVDIRNDAQLAFERLEQFALFDDSHSVDPAGDRVFMPSAVEIFIEGNGKSEVPVVEGLGGDLQVLEVQGNLDVPDGVDAEHLEHGFGVFVAFAVNLVFVGGPGVEHMAEDYKLLIVHESPVQRYIQLHICTSLTASTLQNTYF